MVYRVPTNGVLLAKIKREHVRIKLIIALFELLSPKTPVKRKEHSRRRGRILRVMKEVEQSRIAFVRRISN
jgi:hypothetical protein